MLAASFMVLGYPLLLLLPPSYYLPSSNNPTLLFGVPFFFLSFHVHFLFYFKSLLYVIFFGVTYIRPDDLPAAKAKRKYRFRLAAGVAGEILPEILEKMTDICDVVFVDIQGLIREFGENDGTVRLVNLKDTKYNELMSKIGVLKASAEEAEFIVKEVRKVCCVMVTYGEDGCRVFWKDGEVKIPPFKAVQVDPTGAGDTSLGGFVAGLVNGLAVPDAALLGNFFGSLSVEQIGLPKFDPNLLHVGLISFLHVHLVIKKLRTILFLVDYCCVCNACVSFA